VMRIGVSKLIRVSEKSKKELELIKKEHNFMKLGEAIEFLISEYRRIEAIAESLGFDNTHNFLRFVETEIDRESALIRKLEDLLRDFSASNIEIILELILALKRNDPQRLKSLAKMIDALSTTFEAGAEGGDNSD